jgi:hypothetical protein
MKPPVVLHFVWAAVAACTFAIGYWTATPTVSPADGGRSVDGISSGSLTSRTSHSSQTNSDGSESAGATAVETISPEQVRERAFRVVTDPMSRADRVRQLCELLPTVTSKNWRHTLDAFEAALRNVGGDGGINYSLLLEHVGAVGGAEAVQDALSPEKVSIRGRVSTILGGWAVADGKACVAWLEAQSPEIQDQYMGSVLPALGSTDPMTALDLTFRPGKTYYANGTAAAVVKSTANVFGVKRVEDIFLAMRGRQDLTTDAKQQFFTNLAGRKLSLLQKSNEPAAEVLHWFDTHAGQDYVTADDSILIVTEAAKANPETTMSWLEMQNQRLTPAQAKAGYHGLARELQQQAPQKLTEWLAANPTHPQKDNMMEAATGTLLNAADFDGATRMAAAIGNEEVRARVTAVVERRIREGGSKR